MNRSSFAHRSHHDDGGAVLVMAIVVMLVIGMLSIGLLAAITTGLHDRVILDSARDREYAADGAIEYAVSQVRQNAGFIAFDTCHGTASYTKSIDGLTMRVDCLDASTLTTRLVLERNAVLTACSNTGVACSDATAVIRAQVNFQTDSPSATTISRTYVQSWSVNA